MPGLFGCLIALLVAADWPQFLGPNRDGVSKETGLVDAFPGGGPRVVWRTKVGGGFASPVVVGERVYQFHFKDGKEVLEALSAVDGRFVWATGYPCDYEGGMFREQGPRSTPTVVHDSIVSFGSDGVLQCLSITDGGLKWRRELHKEFQVSASFFGAACSPLVVDDLVLINLGGEPGAGLCAFRLADGADVWKATDDAASYSSPVHATVGGKPTALFFARSGLHGVDAKTGASRFFHPFRARIDASVNAATPLVWNDQVLLASSYGVGAALLDCKSTKPKVVWKSDELSCHYNTPVKVGEHLFGVDGRQEGGAARLVCLEADTGKVKWSEPNVGCAAIVAAKGKLFVLRENGELLLCRANAEKFDRLGAAAAVNGLCRAAPALANGKLYIRSENELVCLDVRR